MAFGVGEGAPCPQRGSLEWTMEVRFLARRLSRVSGCALGRRVEVREEGQVVKRLKEKTAMKYFWPILNENDVPPFSNHPQPCDY